MSLCRLWRLVRLSLFSLVLMGALPGVLGNSVAFAASPEIEALQQELAQLEAQREALRGWLAGDPCAIPPDIGAQGAPLSLPAKPAGQEKSEGKGGSGGTMPPAGQNPPTPGSTTGQPPQAAAPVPNSSGEFKASSDAIDAATPLILTNSSMGTGFFVAPGIVATNRHVIEESPGIIVLLNKSLGGLVRGKLLAVGRGDRDYALIQVESDKPLPEPLPLCGGIRKTDKIASWGFPGAVSEGDPKFQALLKGDLTAIPEGIYSEGVVNVVYETAPSMIMHTAAISQGNSGGPLVNSDGCVVGINTKIHLDDQSYRQTSIALAISDLVAFMQQYGIQPRFRPGS